MKSVKAEVNGKLIAVCFLFSCSVLILSYLAQFVWKIEPCRLCKMQRIPYFFLAGISFLSLLNIRVKIIKIVILFCCLASAILAAYHLLVLTEIMQDFCAVQAKIDSMDDFMKMLDANVPCSKAEWSFLGIPIAGYNLIFSLVFLIFLRTWKFDCA